MPKFTLPSFAKGELSPEIFGRIDVSAYQVGLAKANNAIIHTYGGLSRRSGLKYVTAVADHSYAPLLKRFEFKSTDTYLLEFGEEYIRVIRNDGNVLEDPLDITGISNDNPAVVTISSHGYKNNEEIEINGVVGLTELNGRRFVVKNKTTDTFTLADQFDGSDIDGTSLGTYSSDGTAERVYYISTPYQRDELSTLKFTQSADVVTITHPNHLPRNLTRTDHDAWSLDNINFLPTIDPPRNFTIATGSSAATRRYIVTAISRDNGEESLAATIDTSNDITDISLPLILAYHYNF